MANWNLSGENTTQNHETHYLPMNKEGVPIVYEGIIMDVSAPYETLKFKEKPNEPDVHEQRIKITIHLTKEDIDLPMYCAFKVTRGSGRFSNSKLYDVLEVADLLEGAMNIENSTDEIQTKFLKDNLLGRYVKVLLKTSKKGTPEQYSVIDKITWMREDKVVNEEILG